MAATVATFRQYGAFNAEETDTQLELYLNAAKEALEHAGVPERQLSFLYDVTVYQLALTYHDRRGAMSEGANDVPYGMQSAIHQLRNAAPEVTTEE